MSQKCRYDLPLRDLWPVSRKWPRAQVFPRKCKCFRAGSVNVSLEARFSYGDEEKKTGRKIRMRRFSPRLEAETAQQQQVCGGEKIYDRCVVDMRDEWDSVYVFFCCGPDLMRGKWFEFC